MILNSPAFPQAVSATSPNDNDLLVVAFYTDLLNRPPTSEETTFWTDQLNAGTKLSKMIKCLMMSEEYKQDLVENYYTIYLGRLPDEGELAAGIRDVDLSSSQKFLSRLFATDEYFANHPGAS